MPQRTENICPHKNLSQMLIEALFIIAKGGKNPDIHQVMNG